MPIPAGAPPRPRVRAAIGIGRRRGVRLGDHPRREAPVWARIEDRKTKRRTGQFRGLGEAARRLGVEGAGIVLGHARHGERQAGECTRRRRRPAPPPCSWAGSGPDHGAARALRHLHGPAQQDTDPVAALRQAVQEMAPDEAGGSGECDERVRPNSRAPSYRICAVTSISTFISGRSKPATMRIVAAGLISASTRPQTASTGFGVGRGR